MSSPKEVTIGRILRLVDGPMAPVPCLSRNFYRRCPDCKDEKTCAVRHLFAAAYSVQLERFDTTTLADAMNARPVFETADSTGSVGGIPENVDP